ncbi:MAG: hypothetical protein WC072_08740 [Methanoregulaceae archaeon]|jgi:hypothetical protein
MGKMIYATEEQVERLDAALLKMQEETGNRRLSTSAMIHECVKRYLEGDEDDDSGADRGRQLGA